MPLNESHHGLHPIQEPRYANMKNAARGYFFIKEITVYFNFRVIGYFRDYTVKGLSDKLNCFTKNFTYEHLYFRSL